MTVEDSNLNFNKLAGKYDWLVVILSVKKLLKSQIISVAFYSEREMSKFCSETLISAWGSFTCLKSTTRDQRL